MPIRKQEDTAIDTMPLAGTGSLTDAVERVESIRDIKDLQRHYAQLSNFGRWQEMGQLFADDAVVRWGSDTATGRQEVDEWLRAGVSPSGEPGHGALHAEIIDQPLITLSDDGNTAECRWHGMRFLGDGNGTARIDAGIFENRYRLTDGQWTISRIDFSPVYGGDYATGWTNSSGDGVPIIPRHFLPEQVGSPVGRVLPVQAIGADDAADLARRIDRLNDEDDVRNLQHTYGYYVDRKMWTDAEELFLSDATFRVGGADFAGADGVRQALRKMGPEGLSQGELNDRPLFDVIVDVLPGGNEAVVRGIEIGMLSGPDDHRGFWEFSVFRNRMVKRDGIWRFQEVGISRFLRAEYDAGWGDIKAEVAATAAVLELTRRTSRNTAHTDDRVGDVDADADADTEGLDVLERRLARSLAYDSVDNISAAYGYYLDDFQWPEMAAIFADNGHKQSPFAGYYLGPQRILEAATASHGAPKPADAKRERAVLHWRPQNVIMVSHDGRSANLRTRLFQTRTATTVMPEWTGFHSGSYANDQAVFEDGVWKLWSITIDEYYFMSPSWSGGWASAKDRPADAPTPPASKLLDVCPPDILLTDLGERARGFRGGTGRALEWPEIVPMWFNYRNPVSGRVPDHYWPDCVPSTFAAQTSMTHHGYQLPPTGPSIDGLDVN